MPRRVLYRFALAVICAPVTLSAQLRGATPENADVRAVVQRYLHGLKFNDTLSLRAAFWPGAKLMFLKKDGTMRQLSQSEWYRTEWRIVNKVYTSHQR
ncbi:MAG: nuclear transport factor 2 family protein [bacterium]